MPVSFSQAGLQCYSPMLLLGAFLLYPFDSLESVPDHGLISVVYVAGLTCHLPGGISYVRAVL